MNSPTDSRLAWDVPIAPSETGSFDAHSNYELPGGLATMHLTGLVPYRQAWSWLDLSPHPSGCSNPAQALASASQTR